MVRDKMTLTIPVGCRERVDMLIDAFDFNPTIVQVGDNAARMVFIRKEDCYKSNFSNSLLEGVVRLKDALSINTILMECGEVEITEELPSDPIIQQYDFTGDDILHKLEEDSVQHMRAERSTTSKWYTETQKKDIIDGNSVRARTAEDIDREELEAEIMTEEEALDYQPTETVSTKQLDRLEELVKKAEEPTAEDLKTIESEELDMKKIPPAERVVDYDTLHDTLLAMCIEFYHENVKNGRIKVKRKRGRPRKTAKAVAVSEHASDKEWKLSDHVSIDFESMISMEENGQFCLVF